MITAKSFATVTRSRFVERIWGDDGSVVVGLMAVMVVMRKQWWCCDADANCV